MLTFLKELFIFWNTVFIFLGIPQITPIVIGEIRNTPTEANFQNVGQRSGDGDDGTITLRPMPRNTGNAEPASPEVNSTEGSEGVVNPAASYDESIQE